MSIVHRSREGLILDHRKWIHKVYFSTSYPSGGTVHGTEENAPSHAARSAFYISAKSGVCRDNGENKKAQFSEQGISDSSVPLMMQLFDIRTPFLMDGAAEKRAAALETKRGPSVDGVGECLRRQREGAEVSPSSPDEVSKALSKAGARRLRKKISSVNAKLGSEDQEEGAPEVSAVMEQFSALAMRPEYRTTFYFSPTPADFRSNNSLPRQAAARLLDDTARHAFDEGPSATSGGNAGDVCITLGDEDRFILPPRCSYYQSDARRLACTLPKHLKFKVIVMDPPWWNKHVKRAKKFRGDHHGYEMMSVPELLDLPLRPLLLPDSVVLVWATNNTAILRHFTHLVQQRWSLQVRRTIFWMKVTRGGVPVTSHDHGNPGKLPFERLLVLEPFERLAFPPSSLTLQNVNCSSCGGRSVNQLETNVHPTSDVTCQCRDRGLGPPFEGRTNGKQIPEMECNKSTKRKSWDHTEDGGALSDRCQTAGPISSGDNKMILLVSVPSALHSHKPPLDEVARELGYAGPEDCCLEVFARGLVPGWSSLGLEVLRLQRAGLYDRQRSN